MNNVKPVHPVHMSADHMSRLQSIVTGSYTEEDRILCLTRWQWGNKPANVTVCSLLDILKIEGVQDRIPYPDSTFDFCIVIDMLDRLVTPSNIVAEMHRVLKPGSSVYVEVPYMQPYDHVRGGYWRFTPDGLKLLFKDFVVDEFGIANGPGSTMHWISRIYKALTFDRDGGLDDLCTKAGDSNYCEAFDIFGMSEESLKATDDVLNTKEHAVCIAASYYMIVSKKGDESRGDDTVEQTTGTSLHSSSDVKDNSGDVVAKLSVLSAQNTQEVHR